MLIRRAVVVAATATLALTSLSVATAQAAAPLAGLRAYFVITAPNDTAGAKTAVGNNGGTVYASYDAIGVIVAHSTSTAREIAVRMALGSSPGGIRRLVIMRGLAIAGTGLAAGVLLAATVTRLLRGMLFGVGPLDGPVLLTMAGVLVGIAALACYFPSGQATAVPPATALRTE